MNRFVILSFILLLWSACTKDSPDNQPGAGLREGASVLVSNEGQFGNGNASISYYNQETDSLYLGFFEQINGRLLGDVLQSITIKEDKAWLVVNASQTIEQVRLPEFELETTISGFTSPRYFLPIDAQKAYVTDLYADAIAVVDLNENKIVSNISVPGWTEEMILVGKTVFVSAPWFFDDPVSEKVLVIDSESDILIGSISVGVDPGPMVMDANGDIWVLCKGDAIAGQLGGLYRINPETQSVESNYPFDDFALTFAPRLAVSPDGEVLYFVRQSVYAMPIDATILPAAPLIAAEGRSIHALDVNPADGHVFISDAIDFQQKGKVYEYSATGILIQSFSAGVGPNGFVFY